MNSSKIKPKTFVTIERRQDLEVLHGALLRESRKWVLIQNIEDFRIDGYSLVHKILVKKIRQTSGDKLYQTILAKEGVAKQVKDMPKLDIDDVALALPFLKSLKSPVIIECELLGEWPFSIGFIEEIREDDFDLRYFDVSGKLDKKPRKIKFAHIDRIGIKERYGVIFGKYVKK